MLNKILFTIIILSLSTNCYAGTVRLEDEGVLQGYPATLDIVGDGIAASRVGIEGTITLDIPSVSDALYLKLDCSNDPLTEALTLEKGGDNIHLYLDVYSTDTTDYGRLYFRKSAHNTAGNLTETVAGHWLGNIKYMGVNNVGAFAAGGYMSVQQTGAAGAYIPTSLEWASYSSMGANDNAIVIDDTGKVGFSEATPCSELEITNGTPIITLHNPTHGDADGARMSRLDFRGEQSGGEETMLAFIEIEHYGGFDDQKGRMIFYVNDGDDEWAPTKRLTINPTGVFDFESGDLLTTGAFRLDDAATYINKDVSGNMTFTDAVTGTRTLKNIGCPVYLFIKATAQAEGDLHLSGADWGVNKAIIYTIRVVTSSTDWDLYILQNDNGYAANNANIPKMQIMAAGNGNANIFLNLPYDDEDDSAEVHLYYLDNSGANTADIYTIGTELI